MKALWKSLSTGKQIAALVFLSHFLFILALGIHHLVTDRISPKKPIAIRVVPPAPSLSVASASPKKGVSKAPATAPPKKRESQTSSAKKSVPSKNREQVSLDTALLEEISKNLSALSSDDPPSSKRVPLPIPKSIEKKSSATIEQTTDDPSYEESLVFYLQNSLELPELGEVKVVLKIDSNGSLRNCEILEAQSQRNAEFLKKQLPELAFPWFNGSQAKAFTIVFRNVETH